MASGQPPSFPNPAPQVSRRRALAALGLAIGGSGMALAGCDPNGGAEGEPMSILVIGAGMAGIAAARHLQDAGQAVTVLEARDRIGGRILTDRSLGVPLDLGASWIHGRRGNPLTGLAREAGVMTFTTDYETLRLYTADGKAVSEAELARLYETLEAVLESAADYGETLDHDTSLQAGIDYVLARRTMPESEARLLRFALSLEVDTEIAAAPDAVSLWWWDEGEQFGGPDELMSGGYVSLVEWLAQGLDVRTGHFVQTIAYGPQGVRITTGQGTLEADRAIVTLPLGVLQKGVVAFEPALPTARQEAIGRMGMGLLNKVVFRFPAVFWDEDAEFIGYAGEGNGRWPLFMNLAPVLGEPILLAFNGGAQALDLESLSNEAIISEGLAVLAALYGPGLPAPDATLVTRWAADPLSYGSYSYLPTGATPDDRDMLAEPLESVLYFAGEATSRDYPATVHGALLSGQAAATRLLEDLG